MVSLKDFDAAEKEIWQVRNLVNKLNSIVDHEANELYKRAGLLAVNREPGFPCWTIIGSNLGYFNTPREAVAAFEKLKEKQDEDAGPR